MSSLKQFFREFRALLGIEGNATSHGEKWISSVGALVGILTVYWATQWSLDTAGILLMVASMGASAVLLFAVPHGALSQPWAVIGGHMVSAFIGVTCQQLYPDQPLTPALAVGLSVGAMHYLRCIHPPGGATALAAVIGGPEIHAMGYGYLLTPILVNVVSILVVAVAFNGLFAWRRYPAHLVRRKHQTVAQKQTTSQLQLTPEDFAAALQQLNSYIDVTAEDLAELCELAADHAATSMLTAADIQPGKFYCNGHVGARWSVRQILDQSPIRGRRKDLVIYKTVAGHGAYETGICHRDEFRQWARYEVVPQQDLWVRVDQAHPLARHAAALQVS